MSSVFDRVFQVGVHLAGVGVREAIELQVDQDEAAQAPVEKEEVDAIRLVADPHAPLANDEAEVRAEFQQEGFEMPDQRRFEIALRVFVAQIEEVENLGILDLFVGRKRVTRQRARAVGKHRRLVPRQSGALAELGLDLAIELAHGPTGTRGFGLVEPRGGLVLHRQQARIGRPWQRESGGDLSR
jgi:hypothetical protein